MEEAGKTKTKRTWLCEDADEIVGGGGSRCWQCWQLTRKGIDGVEVETQTKKREHPRERCNEARSERERWATKGKRGCSRVEVTLPREKAGWETSKGGREEEAPRFSIGTGKPEARASHNNNCEDPSDDWLFRLLVDVGADRLPAEFNWTECLDERGTSEKILSLFARWLSLFDLICPRRGISPQLYTRISLNFPEYLSVFRLLRR